VGVLNDRLTAKENWEFKASFDHLPYFEENKETKITSLNTLTSALSTQLADQVITIEEYKQQLINYGFYKDEAD
jgi:hypothetical protein